MPAAKKLAAMLRSGRKLHNGSVMIGSSSSNCDESASVTFPPVIQVRSPASGVEHAHGLDHLILAGESWLAAVPDFQLRCDVL